MWTGKIQELRTGTYLIDPCSRGGGGGGGGEGGETRKKKKISGNRGGRGRIRRNEFQLSVT
jgi:hypothetical protein